MADRRVEPRNFHVGTGTLNDPERLADIAARRQQSELNGRLPPKVTFRAVLDRPPEVAKRAKRKRPTSKEKLTPSAQQNVSFSSDGDETPKGRLVVKV